MADTSSQRDTTDTQLNGTWQTVEQAAVVLGLSVRTVNRHISAQKLKSRLIDGRREVFVANPEPETAAANVNFAVGTNESSREASTDTVGGQETVGSSAGFVPPANPASANVSS